MSNNPTKVGHSQLLGKRMKRELLPRQPQVSVVTQTIFASSTSTASTLPLATATPSIPLGPIVGGVVGGMFIVLLAVGGWMWWGSRVRTAKAKGTKARKAQLLAAARTGHGKTESTDTLNSTHSKSQSQSSYISEKSESAHETVKKPSAILAQQKSARPPYNHNAPSNTSLASSRYAPARPSPLALGVVTRAPSVMMDNPPTVVVTLAQPGTPGLSPQASALRSLAPLPPAVKVVPPSPPPPARMSLAPADERVQRQSVQSVQSVQTVGSEYSLDSPVGVAYGGDEAEHLAYARAQWRVSHGDATQARFSSADEPDDYYFSQDSKR